MVDLVVVEVVVVDQQVLGVDPCMVPVDVAFDIAACCIVGVVGTLVAALGTCWPEVVALALVAVVGNLVVVDSLGGGLVVGYSQDIRRLHLEVVVLALFDLAVNAVVGLDVAWHAHVAEVAFDQGLDVGWPLFVGFVERLLVVVLELEWMMVGLLVSKVVVVLVHAELEDVGVVVDQLVDQFVGLLEELFVGHASYAVADEETCVDLQD